MSIKKTDSFPCALSCRAVPLVFNLPRFRFPEQIRLCSDVNLLVGSFYEYRGLFWFSVTLSGGGTFNSVPFVSVSSAISNFRGFVRDYGLTFEDIEMVDMFCRRLRRRVSPKTAEV